MQKYTLYWRNGQKEVIEADSIASAFNSQYSAGALRALDFYSEGDCSSYDWNSDTREWDRVTE